MITNIILYEWVVLCISWTWWWSSPALFLWPWKQVYFLPHLDGKVSDGLKTYQLVNGKCEPNEKLTLDVDVIMEGENYGEAKVTMY